MPSTTLLLWVLTRSLLLPHEPVTFNLAGPGDLPAGTSVAGLIETGMPAITSDRFDASGAALGTSAKIGAYGESWTEATYRIGDLEATNPLRPGTPIVLLDATGFAGASVTASGTAIERWLSSSDGRPARGAPGSTAEGAAEGGGGIRSFPGMGREWRVSDGRTLASFREREKTRPQITSMSAL